MINQLEYFSYIFKNLVVPIFTVIMLIFTFWIAWKKGLLSEKKKTHEEIEKKATFIRGEGNVINITPSEMQKLAYDPDKFDEYHQQSIGQARISFWFSLIFASVGFLIIATSIFTYSDKTGYIGIIAGTIIDAVSALFFMQSNKARILMSEFFDKLRQDRKLEESLNLCQSIDDEFLRNALKVKLSLFFSGLEDSYNTASEIIRIGKGDFSKNNITNKESEETEHL